MKTMESNGLKLSMKIFDKVKKQLKDKELDKYVLVDTFYNCRESGFVYKVYESTKYEYSLCVWTYENRNSDDIVLLASTNPKHCDFNNVYTDEAYENCRRFFKYNEINKVASELVKLIEDSLNNNN